MKKIKSIFPFILILVTILLTGRAINSGEFWWSDESRHAMDGLFLMDFFKDLTFLDLNNLYRYVEIYFAKYPALGFIWYPPFFALIESIFFSLFGISEITARITVIFFTLISVLCLYHLIKKMYNEVVALLTCLIFITTPVVVFWAKTVMLELPTIALITISLCFFYNYFFLHKKRHIYYLTLALILSLYTKQTAMFIFPLLLSFILVQRQYKKLFNKDMLICVGLFSLMIMPLIIFTLKFGTVGLTVLTKDLQQLKGAVPKLSMAHWLMNFRLLINTFIWPIWILVGLTLLISSFNLIKRKFLYPQVGTKEDENQAQRHKGTEAQRESSKKSDTSFFILWAIWWYIVFVFLCNNAGDTKRYCIYAVPAIALLAVWTVAVIKNNVFRRLMITLISIICLYQGFLSYNQMQNYVYGYKEAAKYVMDNYGGKTVLFGGYYDGNFIFNVRKYDKDKKTIVLRDSKILATWSVYPEWGYRSYVNTKEDIYAILNKYGTRYIVVEDKEVFYKTPLKLLREILKTDDFTLEKSIKVKSNIKKISDMSILIYRYKKENKDLAENLIIEFPLLNRRINVPLKSF